MYTRFCILGGCGWILLVVVIVALVTHTSWAFPASFNHHFLGRAGTAHQPSTTSAVMPPVELLTRGRAHKLLMRAVVSAATIYLIHEMKSEYLGGSDKHGCQKSVQASLPPFNAHSFKSCSYWPSRVLACFLTILNRSVLQTMHVTSVSSGIHCCFGGGFSGGTNSWRETVRCGLLSLGLAEWLFS